MENRFDTSWVRSTPEWRGSGHLAFLSPAEVVHRARGGLYGLILGDIVGSYFEFSSRGPKELPPLEVLADKTNIFGVSFGYTDDTILALLAMEALLTKGGRLDPARQRQQACLYLNEVTSWSPNGRCFDIGTSTLRSLRDGEWPGKHADTASGNGVLMKHLPFALARGYTGEEPLMFYTAVAEITHGSPATVQTALQFGLLLERLLTGQAWGDANRGLGTEWRKEPISPDREYRGYCEDSLVLALQLAERVVHGDMTWERALQNIVDLGGDTDTNAAIFGQVYGTLLPDEIIGRFAGVRSQVHRAYAIDELLDRLVGEVLAGYCV